MKSGIYFTIVVSVMVFVAVSIGYGQVKLQELRPPDPSLPSTASVENFSAASLSKSRLHSDTPQLVEKDEEPEFIHEFYRVQWRAGDPIDLYVIRPTKVKNPPVVIYLYGHPSETDRYRDDGWCKRVTAGGYAAVGFVPALTGHRYHDRPMKEWFVSELQESIGKSTHDVQMVLNYLAQRGDFDISNVGIFGVGAGGTIAVAAASADVRIKAVDLLDPWGDWPTWMAKSEVIPEEERPSYIKPEFLKKVAAFDPVVLLPGLKAHVRLIQLDEDSVNTPIKAKKRIEAALPADSDRRHYATNAEFFGAVASGGRAFDWIKSQLKTSGSTESSKVAQGSSSNDQDERSPKQ